MISLQNILKISKKELNSYFTSITGFLFLAAFLALILFLFFWVDMFFARNLADLQPLFVWMPVLFIFLVPALTMRMWSEERRSGTIEFLLTLPLSNLELVLGKFLSCLILVGIALALTLPLPLSVSLIAGQLDWGPVIGGYIAAVFLAASYTAIGLFISACTQNQIVSLLLSVLFCSSFYLIGSEQVSALFNEEISSYLSLLGTGSRFQSITRGVIDFRDLYYYLSLSVCFLILNVEELQSIRWAGNQAKDHKRWTLVSSLIAFNVIAANFWLGQISWLRVDLSEGQLYSIPEISRRYIRSLQEPLLIRAYLSKKTHPALQALIPRLKDLLIEYSVAGSGKIRLEFVDPLEKPELEKEAAEKYGIKPVAFQTTDKYQAAVTNAYFDILFKYGDQFRTLNWRDLIEIKNLSENNINVDLRNPQYDITSTIKKLLSSYQSGASPFAGIEKPVTLTAYLSSDSVLPDGLKKLKGQLKSELEQLAEQSNKKLIVEFIDPQSDGGKTAEKLQQEFGFRPMARGLLDNRSFWFYFTLRSADQVVKLPIPDDLNPETFLRNVKDSIRRFSKGYLKTIGVFAPHADLPPGVDGDSFEFLKQKLEENYNVRQLNLLDGRLPSELDLLLLIGPENMNSRQLFAVDQFLMKGGTVVLLVSPYDVQVRRTFECRKVKTGLEDWLANYGIKIEKKLVLDSQNFPLMIPVRREAAGYSFIDTQMAPYPYFIDVRKDGMPTESGPTTGINHIILQWASPIQLDAAKNKDRAVSELLRSSSKSWTSTELNLSPSYSATQTLGFPEAKEKSSHLLGVVLEGRFESFFKGKKSPLLDSLQNGKASNEAGKDHDMQNDALVLNSSIEKSPASARIFVYSSVAFLTDKVIYLTSESIGSKYLSSLNLILNTADWSFEDKELLSIRSLRRFARPLRSMSKAAQLGFEYTNYGLAALGLLLIWILKKQIQTRSNERAERVLALIKSGSSEQSLKKEFADGGSKKNE